MVGYKFTYAIFCDVMQKKIFHVLAQSLNFTQSHLLYNQLWARKHKWCTIAVSNENSDGIHFFNQLNWTYRQLKMYWLFKRAFPHTCLIVGLCNGRLWLSSSRHHCSCSWLLVVLLAVVWHCRSGGPDIWVGVLKIQPISVIFPFYLFF